MRPTRPRTVTSPTPRQANPGPISRRVLGAVVRTGIRRGQMRCGVATRVLDLARGVHLQLRLARHELASMER